MSKRFLIVAVAMLVFGASGLSSAVEKKPKDTQTTKRAIAPAPKSKDSQVAKPKEQTPPAKKFDDFVDKNKNGVDDRKEGARKPEGK